MLDRVFCSARDIAKPTRPETVRNEKVDAMPVILKTAAAASTIQRILNASRTVRVSSGDAPALFAALAIILVRNSAISHETAITTTACAIRSIVVMSIDDVHLLMLQAASIQKSSTISSL